jgi:hypothetical protein
LEKPPYGHYLHGKPKRQRLPYDAENQFVKYTDACVESFLGGDMKALFMNKKLSSVVLNNFKPMIPEQFHIWQNGIDTNDYYLNFVALEEEAIS